MVAELIYVVVEFIVESSVFGSKSEEDLACVYVMSDYVSDYIAVNR